MLQLIRQQIQLRLAQLSQCKSCAGKRSDLEAAVAWLRNLEQRVKDDPSLTTILELPDEH